MLFCRFPSPKPSRSVTGTGAHPDAFHCHRVPDSFQLPHCDGFVEVRDPLDLVRAPLIVRYRACFLEGEKVLGDFPGLCKILHETTLLGSCIPVFFPYFCRYRFVLAVLWVEDGSYWSTMVSDCFTVGWPGTDSSQWICRELILQCWSAGMR